MSRYLEHQNHRCKLIKTLTFKPLLVCTETLTVKGTSQHISYMYECKSLSMRTVFNSSLRVNEFSV